jgi:hypothetical protein
MRKSRHPQIGDMIIETCPDTKKKHVGVVYEIEKDNYGHSNCVLIEWSDELPRGYTLKYGYAGVNIHNIRDRFDVFRGGIRIR